MAALDPLATTADLSARGITEPSGRLNTSLAIASAAIRDAAGATISEETSTVVVNGGDGNLLGLPGPITSVAAVSIDGTTLGPRDYEILPNGLWRHCGWAACGRPVRVTVTYTHGLVDVPADIVDLTCSLAKAWLDHVAAGGGSVAGLSSVRLDDAAETYTDEAAGQISPAFIPEATRTWLARRFGGGVQVVETL